MKEMTQAKRIAQTARRLRDPVWMAVFIALFTLGLMLLLMITMGPGSGH